MVEVYGARIFIVQYASIGGPKFGWEDDPEGAWVDHEVFGSLAEAEVEAKKLETYSLRGASGEEISTVRVTRVITLDAYGEEMGSERRDRFLTAYRSRLTEIVRAQRDQ